MDSFEEFEDHVRENLIPKIEGSKIFVSIVPAPQKVDIKFAIELGIAILLDKPIIAAIVPGVKISEKLSRVVDRFVELNMDNSSETANGIREAVESLDKDLDDEIEPN